MLTQEQYISAQAGLVSLDGRPIDQDLFVKLRTGAYHVRSDVGMSYYTFYTTKEPTGGKQPFISTNGFIVIWDGRLDNREELATKLGVRCDSAITDVSLFGSAYEVWGNKCFAHIRGDWAASIWDPKRKTLVLARDYAGIRKLYYRATPHNIVWATHLATIVGSRSSIHCDLGRLCSGIPSWISKRFSYPVCGHSQCAPRELFGVWQRNKGFRTILVI